MKTNLQKIKYWTSISIIGVVLGVGLQFVKAWTEPAVAPPGGNVAAPLSVSNVGQAKAGGLVLNTAGAANGLIVQNGNVGIGTVTPVKKLEVVGDTKITGGIEITGQLKMAGGSPGTGKVLTSDASGLASWSVPETMLGANIGSYPATHVCGGQTLGAGDLIAKNGKMQMIYAGGTLGLVCPSYMSGGGGATTCTEYYDGTTWSGCSCSSTPYLGECTTGN